MDRILPQQSSNDKPLKLEIKQHQEVVVLTEMSSKAWSPLIPHHYIPYFSLSVYIHPPISHW